MMKAMPRAKATTQMQGVHSDDFIRRRRQSWLKVAASSMRSSQRAVGAMLLFVLLFFALTGREDRLSDWDPHEHSPAAAAVIPATRNATIRGSDSHKLGVSGLKAVASVGEISDRRRDAERLQRFFHAQQFPAECDSARFYFYDGRHQGLGSQVGEMAQTFLTALAAGFVFVDHYPFDYTDSGRCASREWNCTFKRLSGCAQVTLPRWEDYVQVRDNRPSAELTPEGQRIWLSRPRCYPGKSRKKQHFQMPVGALAERCAQGYVGRSACAFVAVPATTGQSLEATLRARAGIEGQYGEKFYFAEAVRYLLRPNEEMERFVAGMRTETLGSLLPSEPRRVLALHIRAKNDKTKEVPATRGLTQHYFLDRIINTTLAHAAERARGARVHAGFEAVLVAADSTKAIRLVERLLPQRAVEKLGSPLRVVPVPLKFFSDKLMGFGIAARLIERNKALLGHSDGALATRWDEGMALVAQIFLMAEMGGLVCSAASSFARLVDAYRSALTHRDVGTGVAYFGRTAFHACWCDRFGSAAESLTRTYAPGVALADLPAIHPFLDGGATQNDPVPERFLRNLEGHSPSCHNSYATANKKKRSSAARHAFMQWWQRPGEVDPEWVDPAPEVKSEWLSDLNLT